MKKPFKLYRSEDGQYYFTVSARNGKVLATSETYHRRGGAINAIRALLDISIDTLPNLTDEAIEDLT